MKWEGGEKRKERKEDFCIMILTEQFSVGVSGIGRLWKSTQINNLNSVHEGS